MIALAAGVAPRAILRSLADSRRILRYRLRTLLSLMVLAAVSLALLTAVRTKSQRTAMVVDHLTAAGATLTFDGWSAMIGRFMHDQVPPQPNWLRTIFGTYAFADIVCVDAGRCRLSSADVDLVCELPRLRFLFVNGENFGNDNLERLASARTIETLWLQSTRVTDEGLSAIKRMEALRSLDLCGGKLGDEAMRRIAANSRLTRLHIENIRLTDDGVLALSHASTLETLHIIGAEITDKGIEHLVALKRLSSLALRRTKISSSALISLGNMKELRDVSLGGVALRDEDVVHLTRLALEQLDLMNTSLDDWAAQQLSQIRSLKFLCLSGDGVTDDGIAFLGQLEQLETLMLDDTAVTECGVRRLKEQSSARVIW